MMQLLSHRVHHSYKLLSLVEEVSGVMDLLWIYWERLKHLPELPLWAEVLGGKRLVCLKKFSVHSSQAATG